MFMGWAGLRYTRSSHLRAGRAGVKHFRLKPIRLVNRAGPGFFITFFIFCFHFFQLFFFFLEKIYIQLRAKYIKVGLSLPSNFLPLNPGLWAIPSTSLMKVSLPAHKPNSVGQPIKILSGGSYLDGLNYIYPATMLLAE